MKDNKNVKLRYKLHSFFNIYIMTNIIEHLSPLFGRAASAEQMRKVQPRNKKLKIISLMEPTKQGNKE